MSDHVSHTNASSGGVRLSRTRIAPLLGGRGVTLGARIAMAGLLAGCAWLGYGALRPLPAPDAFEAPKQGAITDGVRAGRAIEPRERTLASLRTQDNMFSPERLPWTPATRARGGDAEEASEIAETPAPSEPAQTQTASSAGGPLDGIEISEPPSAIARELSVLYLRGVYGREGEYTAVIRDGSLPVNEGQTHHYRPGDAVGKAEWRLLAIDPSDDRVILHRAGHNVELRMYPKLAGSPRAPEQGVSTAPTAEGEVTVARISRDQARQELEAAGVSAVDINELLMLAERPDHEAASAQAGAQAGAQGGAQPGGGTAPAAQRTARTTRAMPAEMVDLLRMMATNAPPPELKDEPKQDAPKQEGEGESGGGG